MGFEKTITGPACLTLEYGVSAVPNNLSHSLLKGYQPLRRRLRFPTIRFDKHSHDDVYIVYLISQRRIQLRQHRRRQCELAFRLNPRRHQQDRMKGDGFDGEFEFRLGG